MEDVRVSFNGNELSVSPCICAGIYIILNFLDASDVYINDIPLVDVDNSYIFNHVKYIAKHDRIHRSFRPGRRILRSVHHRYCDWGNNFTWFEYIQHLSPETINMNADIGNDLRNRRYSTLILLDFMFAIYSFDDIDVLRGILTALNWVNCPQYLKYIVEYGQLMTFH